MPPPSGSSSQPTRDIRCFVLLLYGTIIDALGSAQSAERLVLICEDRKKKVLSWVQHCSSIEMDINIRYAVKIL